MVNSRFLPALPTEGNAAKKKAVIKGISAIFFLHCFFGRLFLTFLFFKTFLLIFVFSNLKKLKQRSDVFLVPITKSPMPSFTLFLELFGVSVEYPIVYSLKLESEASF